MLDIFTKPKSATTREFIRAIINYDLPHIFLDTSFSDTPLPDGNLVLRLSFIGHAAGEPIIAGMIRRFNVDTSILYGNIDHIQSTPFGTLLVELSGEQQNIESALNYLRAKDLGIEVIGYVARNARAAG